MDKLHQEMDVLLFDGVNILDLAGPVQAFKSALIAKSRPMVCALSQLADRPCGRVAVSV